MTIYFLSDFGYRDEFVGVVHAVLGQEAPGVPVIDLTHGIEPFDVVSGAQTLVRCAPFLGDGVVLAVVDPGVASFRAGVVVETEAGSGPVGGPRWLVGPDNGLLCPIAETLGGARRAVRLDRRRSVFAPARSRVPDGHGSTFDGRDLFAPAAAHLARANDPAALGDQVAPGGLVAGPNRPSGRIEAGPAGPVLVTSVASVDRYGNLALHARPGDLATCLDIDIDGVRGRECGVTVTVDELHSSAPEVTQVQAVWVSAFADCPPGRVGILVDSSGQLALVCDRSSAARALGLDGGDRLPAAEVRIQVLPQASTPA